MVERKIEGGMFMRKKVIAGNWKMNMLPNEAISMITELVPLEQI